MLLLGIKRYFKKFTYRDKAEREKFLSLCNEEMRFKIICHLRKRLKKAGDKFQEKIDREDPSLEHKKSNKIFIFWWQGMDEAPEIVRICYQSVLDRLSPTHEIVLLTKDNYRDYVKIPPRIEELLQKKVIPIQYLADFLRLQLLIEHGGTWMDATVLCTGEIPDYVLSAPLFTPQTLFPATFGCACRMENWFIHAESNNKILRMTYLLLNEYFRKKSVLCDYLLTYDLMELAIERYDDLWQKIPPCANANLLTLQNRMPYPFDEKVMETILENAFIHKLNWRIASGEGTFYGYVKEHFPAYKN